MVCPSVITAFLSRTMGVTESRHSSQRNAGFGDPASPHELSRTAPTPRFRPWVRSRAPIDGFPFAAVDPSFLVGCW